MAIILYWDTFSVFQVIKGQNCSCHPSWSWLFISKKWAGCGLGKGGFLVTTTCDFYYGLLTECGGGVKCQSAHTPTHSLPGKSRHGSSPHPLSHCTRLSNTGETPPPQHSDYSALRNGQPKSMVSSCGRCFLARQELHPGPPNPHQLPSPKEGWHPHAGGGREGVRLQQLGTCAPAPEERQGPLFCTACLPLLQDHSVPVQLGQRVPLGSPHLPGWSEKHPVWCGVQWVT